MNKTWKKKWIKALTSGKYKEYKGQLRSEPSHPDAYCCLGVLCDIVDPKPWKTISKVGYNYYTYLGSDARLPTIISEKTNVSGLNQDVLTEMNDKRGKRNFIKIAAWIDKNL